MSALPFGRCPVRRTVGTQAVPHLAITGISSARANRRISAQSSMLITTPPGLTQRARPLEGVNFQASATGPLFSRRCRRHRRRGTSSPATRERSQLCGRVCGANESAYAPMRGVVEPMPDITARRSEVVAYEADRLDFDTLTGWSVVVTGTATRVSDPVELARYRALLAPWVDTEMGHVIRIRAEIVTGYRLARVTPS